MTAIAQTMTRFAAGAGRIDRVWLTLFLAFALGLALATTVALEAMRFVAEAMLSILPFLALAIGTAAAAKASGRTA